MEYQITETRCFWAGVIGTMVSLLAFVVSGKLEIGTLISKNNNIVALLIACIVFAAATIVGYAALGLFKGKFVIRKLRFPQIVFLLLAVLTFVLLYGMLLQDDGYAGAEVSEFWWHIIPSWIVMLIFSVVSFAGIYAVLANRNQVIKRRRLLYVYYVIAAVIYTGTVVYLNVYAGDLYHIDAYVHPIYSVFYNTPYSELSYGIYGHYELFYKLPMLLFGTSPRVICATIAVITFIEALIFFYVMDQLTKSKVIKLLIPLAFVVPTGCMFLSSSYQSTPHRIVFPMCLILYAVKLGQKERRMKWSDILVGHFICAVAVLWNTETGFICCVAWTAYILARLLTEKDLRWGTIIFKTAVSLLMTALDVGVAIVIVNLYNVIVGGNFVFKEFFYPFINGGFMNHYSIRLLFENRPYIYIMVLCFATITYGASKTRIFQKNVNGKTNAPVIFMIGIILLGQLTYYMTRAAYYGLLITFPFVLILMAYYADYFCRRALRGDTAYTLTESLKGAIAGTQIAAISILALLSGGLGDGYAKSFEMGRYSIDSPWDVLGEMQREVIPNTYAVGWGTDEIYGDFGWNTGYHMLGTTDVLVDVDANSNVFGTLVQEANEQDHLLLNTNAYYILREEYQLIKEYTVYGQTYGYFKKVEKQ